MLRKALVGAAVTGTAVLTSFAVASPAMAGTNAQAWTYYAGQARGVANWSHNGDLLTVCDESADGWGIRGTVYSLHPDGFWQFEMAVNDPSATGGCENVTKNVPDGRTIEIAVWQYKGSETYGYATDRGVA